MCAKSIWNLFLPVILFALTSGCAISNQGAVDYRYNRPGSTSGELQPKYISLSNAKNKIVAGDPIAVSICSMVARESSPVVRFLRWERNKEEGVRDRRQGWYMPVAIEFENYMREED